MDDGRYPTVKLMEAELWQCEKTTALAKEINTEYFVATELKKNTTKQILRLSDISENVKTTTEKAYLNHYKDIAKRQVINNYNKLDSMIAVRLRGTGHSKNDIESAIKQCAPIIRLDEKQQGHHWNDYAKRTANYAFGSKADADIEKLAKYAQAWSELEGSEMLEQSMRGSFESKN